jgi:hypothetical protein
VQLRARFPRDALSKNDDETGRFPTSNVRGTSDRIGDQRLSQRFLDSPGAPSTVNERIANASFGNRKWLCGSAPDVIPAAMREEIKTLVRRYRSTCSNAREFEEAMAGTLEVFLVLWSAFVGRPSLKQCGLHPQKKIGFADLHQTLMGHYGHWSRFYSEPD